ncbi:MAG: hypothetical protein ACJ780_04250 [Solirubrobacteraceae bacterium]
MWTTIRLPGAGGAWRYFAEGSRLLFHGGRAGGLHLYAAHPELQIGPIAFLVAAPLRALGWWPSRVVAVALMSMTGPLVLGALWRLVPPSARRPWRLGLAGLVFLPGWAELVTHAGHLDDVLALGFGVAALHAVAHGRAVPTGLLVAAAADAKPWALAFAPLVLVLPARTWWRAAAAVIAGIAVAWLPFLLYDPGTWAVTRFAIPNAVSSGLRALGVTDPATPSWDRPAQLLLGCALGTAAVLRRRWPAIILLATAARILLDPEVFSYYISGVLLGAVAADLVVMRWRFPWLTSSGLVTLHLMRLAGHVVPIPLHVLGLVRAGYVVAASLVVLLAKAPAGRRTAIPARRSGDVPVSCG